eukprot:comp19227_c0_seq1/m.21991 comp19227_c0_seq1/g.21991  ORF comp19227_c0_seq1/g.21991 comp19227_c0_seq1/m.21991 type:complete len:295 (-) comp19227_c0_seq1:622-1506(-)
MAFINAENARSIIDEIDCFVFDCDGVIWEGSNVIPGAPEAIAKLRQLGKRIVYVSNNSSKSRVAYAEKLKKMGFIADKEDVVGSAYAAAFHLRRNLGLSADKKVYVVGMSGIKEELVDVGLTPVGADEDNIPFDISDIEKWTPDPSVGAVVSGLDMDINYVKFSKACRYIQNPDVLFIATNDDSTLPLAGDIRIPGSGALLSVLITATKRQPIICGNPPQPMLEVVMNKFNLDPKRSCMVGDRLNTDIAFGNAGGLKTLLVLTGISTLEESNHCSADQRPLYVIPSIGDLVTLL